MDRLQAFWISQQFARSAELWLPESSILWRREVLPGVKVARGNLLA